MFIFSPNAASVANRTMLHFLLPEVGPSVIYPFYSDTEVVLNELKQEGQGRNLAC